jgi:hypothetical protein
MVCRGIPGTAFQDLLNIVAYAGGDVGPGPHNRNFVKLVSERSHVRILEAARETVSRPLPVTGRPPDVELMGDGGSFGCYYRMGGDAFFTCGVTVPSPTWPFRLAIPLGWIGTSARGHADDEVEHLSRLVKGAGLGRLDEFIARQVGTATGDQALATGGEPFFVKTCMNF